VKSSIVISLAAAVALLISIPTGAGAVAVGDFNQDGNLDVAFASGTGAQVGVAYGNGHGAFGTPIF